MLVESPRTVAIQTTNALITATEVDPLSILLTTIVTKGTVQNVSYVWLSNSELRELSELLIKFVSECYKLNRS